MTPESNKRPRAVIVKPTTIEHAGAFLHALPEKPKESMSLKEAVEQLRESLNSALRKGYTYQELASMLSERGMPISAFTLKNYAPSGKRQAAKDKKISPRSRKQANKDTAAITVAEPVMATPEPVAAPAPEAEPAPTRRRGRSATTKTQKEDPTRSTGRKSVAPSADQPKTTRGRRKANS